MKKLIALLIISHVSLNCFAQDQHLIDSLEAQLKSLQATKLELGKLTPESNDSTVANILNNLCEEYWDNDVDKGMEYANQCLSLSKRIGFKNGMRKAYNSMGALEGFKGNYLSSIEFHRKALKISVEIGSKRGIAGAYNNIANNYLDQGNYPEALKNYFAALKMNKESGNKEWQALNLNNIGRIYEVESNYPEVLKNYFAALKLRKEIGDKPGMAASYLNIGDVYSSQGNFTEGLKIQLVGLKISEEIGNKRLISEAYFHIGTLYQKQSNYPEALKNYFVAIKLFEEMKDKTKLANVYYGVGEIYFEQNKYNEASVYLNKGLSLFKELGALDGIKWNYKILASLDSAQGNFDNAFEHYKLFNTYGDSIDNTENTKKMVALQMNFDFDKKQDSLNAVQAKKDLVASNEKNKQRLLRNSFIGGFALMLIFAGIFFRQRNKIKKGKQKSDELLLNILPSEVADELKDTGNSKAKNFSEATVMFTDFKDFTNISEQMSPEELVREIDTCFSAFDHIIHKYGIEKIKTIGDAYMCAGGLPVANKSHAEDVVKAALEIRNFMANHNKENITKGEVPFEIRIGINTGPVVAGIVGVRKFAYDIWGDTVNLANRMESHGEAGQVNISASTYELVKDKYTCVHRGKIMTKSKGEMDMYFVERS